MARFKVGDKVALAAGDNANAMIAIFKAKPGTIYEVSYAGEAYGRSFYFLKDVMPKFEDQDLRLVPEEN